MKTRNQVSKKHIPTKWRKYKGRFGQYQKDLRPTEKKPINFPKKISITDDNICLKVFEAFQKSKRAPQRILDFREVEIITLRGGLALKAFFDEFNSLYGRKPDIRGPLNKKGKAIFKFLKLKNYNINCKDYKDLICWQIYEFTENDQKKTNLPELLFTEIIPKNWETHQNNIISKNIVTSVSEALYNCQEHAYKGDFENRKFQNWYLGVGEYPDTNNFSFCIYDKGQGIKKSMKRNSSKWDSLTENMNKDFNYIDFAVKGLKMKASYNRGQGLKTAVSQISKAGGGNSNN